MTATARCTALQHRPDQRIPRVDGAPGLDGGGRERFRRLREPLAKRRLVRHQYRRQPSAGERSLAARHACQTHRRGRPHRHDHERRDAPRRSFPPPAPATAGTTCRGSSLRHEQRRAVVHLANVTGFEILDKAARREELSKGIAGPRRVPRRPSTWTVDSSSQGARCVIVGCVHGCRWKTSYRMVPARQGLQGDRSSCWVGHRRDTTDRDWKQRALGLVSGRPVSFQMDLHCEPLFVARTWVSVPTIAGVFAAGYGLGVDRGRRRCGRNGRQSAFSDAPSRSEEAKRAARVGSAGRGMPRRRGPEKSFIACRRGRTSRQTLPAASGELRELPRARPPPRSRQVQYQVDQPVSIERPALGDDPGIIDQHPRPGRVSIFSSADGSEYPRRGVEIKNTGNASCSGPDQRDRRVGLRGDAGRPDPQGATNAFLLRPLDLNVTAINRRSRNDSRSPVWKINDGLLLITSKLVNTTTYEFANKDSARRPHAHRRHSKWDGWKLVSPPSPAKKPKDLTVSRWTLLPARPANSKFYARRWCRRSGPRCSTAAILQTVIELNRSGKVSDKVLEAVHAAASKQNAINQTQRHRADRRPGRRDHRRAGARIREKHADHRPRPSCTPST